jgi:predicted PurR-regulated permease PerM
MTGTQFERILTHSSRLALLITGALALVVALALGKVILAPISLAIVVGLMFGPIADMMERRGVPAALSAALVLVAFVGLLSVAALLFAGPIAEWVARGPVLWERLRTQLAGLKEPLETLGVVQEQLKGLMGSDAAVTVEVQDGGPVTGVALMAPAIAADIVLFLAGLYFFLATRHSIRLSVLSLCFSRRVRWRSAHVFRDVELKVSRFLISAAAINAGLGAATALAMWALGMPSPLLWGALAAVMNFIPYVGQAVMLVILFAVGLGTQTTWVGILLPVAAYGALNLTADQIVFPHLMGRALTLNPFVIFVSIAFWLWLWGPMGGFVAVPSLLVLQSLILHIFPSTQALPGMVRRRRDARANADVKQVEQVQAEAKAPPQPPPAVSDSPAPKSRRSRRKPAIPASP